MSNRLNFFKIEHVIVLILAIRGFWLQFEYFGIEFFRLKNFPINVANSLAILLLLLITIVFFKKRSFLKIEILALFIVIYFLFVGATRIQNGFFNGFLYIYQFFMVFIISSILYKKIVVNKIFNLFNLFLILLLITHYSKLLIDIAGGAGFEPLKGFFASKHTAAISLFLLLPFPLYRYFQSKERRYLIVTALTAIAIFLTFQRKSVLEMFIVFLYFMYATKRLSYVVGLSIIFVIFLYVFPVEDVIQAYSLKNQTEIELAKSGDIGALGAGRVGIVLYGLNMYWNDYNFFEKLVGRGLGAGHFAHFYVMGGVMAYSHVQWLQILLDVGIVGVLLFIAFFLKLYRYIKRAIEIDTTVMSRIVFAFFIAFQVGMVTGMQLQGGGASVIDAFLFAYPVYLVRKYNQKLKMQAQLVYT
ncbi:hypothetical protein [Lutibacter sp.]